MACSWPVAATLLRIVGFHLVLRTNGLFVDQHDRSSRSGQISLVHFDQAPGQPPPYVEYGPPQFTTFSNATYACKACVEFYPEVLDGKRAPLYKDTNGGEWVKSCRAGMCDFRDPQLDPIGGVVGRGVGPGGKPDGKTCITRDPVLWYRDCGDVLLESTYTTLDVTRYCTFKTQIWIPPPMGTASYFAGKPAAWGRVAGGKEQCMATIEKNGAALLDTMSFCDSDIEALGSCCQSVYEALSCLTETTVDRGIGDETTIFAAMSGEATQMMETFKKYCVPMCDDFCKVYPFADVCVNHETCDACTKQGGLWCPKLKSCHCPSPTPPCIAEPIRTPLTCSKLANPKLRFGGNRGSKGESSSSSSAKKAADKGSGAETDGIPTCKYSEFAAKFSSEKPPEK